MGSRRSVLPDDFDRRSFEGHVRTRWRGKAKLNSPLPFLEYQHYAAGQFQQDRSLY
jgi:hypothetical protein